MNGNTYNDEPQQHPKTRGELLKASGERLKASGELLKASGEMLKAEGKRLKAEGKKALSPQRDVIRAARLISAATNPFYLPVLGLLLLFTLSYLSIMPLGYKLQVLLLVYLLTALAPRLLIAAYRRYNGWTLIQLGQREKRFVPYLISISCYLACVWLMRWRHIPHLMESIVTAALVVQMLCLFINMSWKISIHTASIGGVAGAVMIFALLFGFDPIGWLSLCFFLAGILGTSRMLLRQHTLGQVVGGFFVGMAAAIVGLLVA